MAGIGEQTRGIVSAVPAKLFAHFRQSLSTHLAALLLLSPLSLSAQGVDVYTNYEERIGSRSTPTMQEMDAVFGARTNVATGGVAFSVPVLSIPGNNGLDLSVTYKLGLRNLGGVTEWYFEEDEPYLSGSFSDSLGWVTTNGGDSRCSNVNVIGYGPPNAPSSSRPGTFYTDEYWSGYFLSLPNGAGRLNRFTSTSSGPTAGGPYKWATNDLWYFSCIPLATGGTGEGFVGHSPDGLKYFFNTMRDVPWLPVLYKLSPVGLELELERKEIRIYAGKVEDRFGNYITGLTASDGRNVTKSVSGSTTTYTYGARQWVVQNTHPTFTVTYPDGSIWSATVNGVIQDYVSLKTTCPGDIRDLSPSTFTTATIHSPSGATGIYTLKQVLLGYSYVSGQCVPLDGGGNAIDRQSVMISSALVQRVVSGPGLMTETLNIDYGPSNDCYFNANYWSPKCDENSPTWRTITHSYSSGRYKRYTFGNRVFANADLLLKLEEGTASNPPLRTTEYEYSLMPRIGKFVGAWPFSVGEHSRAVMIRQKTLQDGRSFSWRVPSDCGGGAALCIDQYGRPTKVVKESTPSP